MERDSKAYLFDVVENCDKILQFIAELDLDAYKKNELVKSAVERCFINIGEALSRLTKENQTLAGSLADAPRIIAFRNVLVHGYESISDELVWEIIQDHLPELKTKCEELLEIEQ